MTTSASRAMIATSVVLMVLACISVVLRLHLQRKTKSPGHKADDWLIVAALAFSIALAVTNIVGVPVGGFGVPFDMLSDAKAQTFLKFVFVMQFWYLLAVALVKLSILCLYGRLFSAGRYPMVIRIFLLLTLAWLISFLFATFFQVWPIRCNWVACQPTTNYTVMYLCSSVTDILLDIAILCIPASFIRKLNTSQSQKIGLVGIFGLGIFCVIASIARLAYTAQYTHGNIVGNYEVNFGSPVIGMIMWSGIEACASTICANLPCYGPLLKQGLGLKSTLAMIRSVFTSGHKLLSGRSTSRDNYAETSSTERFAYEPNVPHHGSSINGRMRGPTQGSDVELGHMKR